MTLSSKHGALPPELELAIVEFTVRAHPEIATTLALVAQRFQTWVEAILYETIVLDYPPSGTNLFLRTLKERPSTFFERTVKRIYITTSVPAEDAARVLAVCTGASDVTCWTRPTPPIQYSKHLRRLSVDSQSLLASPITVSPHITHLDLVNPPPLADPHRWACIFAQFPKLTHVALGNLYALGSCDHRAYIPLFCALLAGSDAAPRLSMLVVVSDDADLLQFMHERVQDPRLVVMPYFNHPYTLADYWKGVNTRGMDFWNNAEELMTMQMRRAASP
ncbi:hypothetical protein BD626DRAFT_563901 [Schizophyllum amplum]|uniref:F-box domain-containing protein n=1 Tax=Schizophyllum amplum TaxID=97359 RepID=A0A550CZM2_9AGAR|nr:hypothetical protein BD626DRAFT_563901 [Auriculariopsis ampla]